MSRPTLLTYPIDHISKTYCIADNQPLHDLCLKVLTLHGIELRLCGSKEFSLLVLLMSHIRHSSFLIKAKQGPQKLSSHFKFKIHHRNRAFLIQQPSEMASLKKDNSDGLFGRTYLELFIPDSQGMMFLVLILKV